MALAQGVCMVSGVAGMARRPPITIPQPEMSCRAAAQRLQLAHACRLSAEGLGRLWPCHRSPAHWRLPTTSPAAPAMELPLRSRPRHPPAQRESGRSSEAQIRQEGSRFGATHAASGATVFQGNFVGLTFNSSTAARADFAGHFAHAALEPVKAFVPRSSLHDQIHAQLARDAAHGSTRTLVVWGLGGAGKTQLVLDYVQQHRDEYKATFWLEAGRKESLERDFVRLYQTLFGLHASAGAETATTVSVEDAVTGVKSWFAGQRGPWLMVFDGADTIEDEGAEGYIDIRHFIPSTTSLDVIVTSRSSTAKDMTRLEGVQVGEMEAWQAAELFQKYACIPRHETTVGDEVLCIVKELGCLALAVTLAATYVGSTPRLQSNIKAYLPEYRQRRRDLLQRKPVSLVHQYSESVLTTWETSYAAVAGQCAEAAVLMTLLSFLSFDDIYLELFCVGDVDNRSEQTGYEAGAGWKRLVSPQRLVDVHKIEECFAVLQKYSLVQWKAGQRGYSMHKLVHAWGHDRLVAEEQSTYGRAAFGLVVEAIEGCSRAPDDKLRLVPHVMESFAALIGANDRLRIVTEDVVDAIAEAGAFVDKLGRWPEVRAISEYVLKARRTLFGEDHRGTIMAMSNLASTLGDQGQLEEAAQMQKEVLEKMKRILGEEHPHTISAMNNLAITLADQGQLEEAAQMQKEVLEKRTRILGEEHPATISAMNNLAGTLADQGQLEEAAQMKKEVLEKMKRILGEEHPATISAMSNLASTLGDQGQLEEAAEMQKKVLEKRTRILGEEHPDTISAMNNLASTLGDQGQLEEAAQMKKEVLKKQMRILGEEHPATIRAMNNLANTLQQQGQLEEAAQMQKEVLEKRTRILGEEHPATIRAMNNLANTLQQQGQLEEAAEMQKEVLEKQTRILGEEHPHTITVMSNLAITLGDQGQLEEAAQMKKEVLEKQTRILGEEHPDTISAMNNLANTLQQQGQLEEAAEIQKKVLEKRTRILGEEHPATIRAMNNLASTLGDQGQLEEAAEMQKEVLEKQMRILGEEHPHTITAMSNLAATLGEQGHLEDVAKMQKEVLEKRKRILGEDHPATILAMNNLAITLRQQGQLEEAAEMQKEVLEKRTRILGEEHPDIISAMNNLANTLQQQGQLEEAAEMQKEVLEKQTRILGEDHPATIRTKTNLAITLRQQSLQDQEQSQSTADTWTQAALVGPQSVLSSPPQASGRKRTKLITLAWFRRKPKQ